MSIHCSNALELIVTQTRNIYKKELFSIFHESFVQFHLKIGNFDFYFWKIQIKIVKALICGKCARARETNFFFILA